MLHGTNFHNASIYLKCPQRLVMGRIKIFGQIFNPVSLIRISYLSISVPFSISLKMTSCQRWEVGNTSKIPHKTSMHSSRMHTARLLTVFPEGEGICLPGGSALLEGGLPFWGGGGSALPGGIPPNRRADPPPPLRRADRPPGGRSPRRADSPLSSIIMWPVMHFGKRQTPYHWIEWVTHAYENITFADTIEVKIYLNKRSGWCTIEQKLRGRTTNQIQLCTIYLNMANLVTLLFQSCNFLTKFSYW